MISKRVGSRKVFLLFVSIAISVNVIGTSAWSQYSVLDLKMKDLNINLKEVETVDDLVKTLAKAAKTLLKELNYTYSIPDHEKYQDPVKVIRDHDFDVSEETIESEDGFILTAWRIKCNKCDDKKYPVLLQHGLFCSGADWLYLGRAHGLPYLLADAGYEVWIGNARGTKYSQKHKNFKIHDSGFWNHSVHDMGVYDVPATIDHIKAVTKKAKVNYVGYSMGTTMFFIYHSERAEHYAASVNRFVGLAPAMYISRLASTLKLLGPVLDNDVLHDLLEYLGQVAGAPADGPGRATNSKLSLFNFLAPYLVPLAKKVLNIKQLRSLITGDPLIKNTPAVQRAMGYFPENISLRTVRHYVQFFRAKTFANFDNGNATVNKEKFLELKPPQYAVGDVTVPSLLIGGLHDPLVVPADFEETVDKLRYCNNVAKCAKVEYNMIPCFTHLDFVWGPGEGTKELVYDQISKWFDNTWKESNYKGVTRRSCSSDYCRDRYPDEPFT